jgi:predicted metalloendopeptidase
VGYAALVAGLFAWGTGVRAQSRTVEVELPAVEHFSVSMADTTVDPCTDFFKYACNKWNKANPIPADQPAWGTFNQLAIWNLSALHATLEKAAVKSDTRTPAEQKAGDYYAACMDEATVDKLGITQLQQVLDKIAQLKDKGQLPELMAYLHQRLRPGDLIFTDVQYAGVLFGIYAQPDFDNASMMDGALDQSGMGLPAREFYLKDDAKSKTVREQYVAHIALILELSGETKEKAAADAKSVMAFETVLAKSAMDIVARRDPKNQNNKMTREQLQALTPGFTWATYLKAMGTPSVPQYLVLAPDFFRGIQTLIADQPVEVWRAYLRYAMVNQMAGFLSKPFVDENFAFYGHTLNGSPQIAPRWRRCSRNADIDLGDAVGQAYVAEYFSAESKARMLKLVAALETALGQDIDSIDWMSASTKKLAHEKLAAQVDKIGYPNK